MTWKVPFVDPQTHYRNLKPEVDAAITDCLTHGDLIARHQLRDFERHLADFVGVRYAVGVNSGYHALRFALEAAGAGAGDEVITVGHTFVATVSAIVHCDARPVLVEVGGDFNMDVEAAARAITPRTKVLLPVHLNGRVCDMDRLGALARRHHLAIVEDACQSLGGYHGKKMAGSFGLAGCWSFYPFKILGGFGDGGAITTNDADVARRATWLRYNGEDRETGEFHCHGQTALLDNVQAAVLDVKLRYLPDWIEQRRRTARLYHEALTGIPQLTLPPVDGDGHFDVFQNYVVRTAQRDALRRHLAEDGVETLVSWPKPMWHHLGLHLEDPHLPGTESVCREVLSLPMSAETTEVQVKIVAQSVLRFFAQRPAARGAVAAGVLTAESKIMTAELVFWSAVAALFYTYAGYHLLLRFAALFAPAERVAPPTLTDASALTSISIVVAVYNEERAIEARLQNLLCLDYPRDQLGIIVASDGSTDRTHEITRAHQCVRLLELGRVGKGPAQDAAVAAARGEIIIFTDADTEFAPDFARVVAHHFARDPRVGGLAANLKWKIPVASNAPSRLRQLSWKLETDLRKTESRLGLLASASGAAMALRKSLWQPMRFALSDSDSITPLDIIRQGYKVIFAPDAVAYEVPFTSARSDFKAKVRGVSKSLATIPSRWSRREWARHPLIAWRTLSHHILRWVAPYLMLAAVIASLFLLNQSPVYQAIVLAEAALAALAAAGYVAERTRKPVAVASLVYSFLVVNAGFAWGFIKGVRGAAQGLFETE